MVVAAAVVAVVVVGHVEVVEVGLVQTESQSLFEPSVWPQRVVVVVAVVVVVFAAEAPSSWTAIQRIWIVSGIGWPRIGAFAGTRSRLSTRRRILDKL